MSEDQAKSPEQPLPAAEPQKELKKSTKRLFAHGKVSPEVGRATRIKPGEVRNPGGRPKRKPITDAYAKMGNAKVPLAMLKALKIENRRGMTFFELAALGMLKKMAEGDVPVAKELTDRLEGPVPDARAVSVLPGGRIEDLEDGSALEQLTVVSARFRERIAKRVPVLDAK
jgi:hypothetical protein